MKANSKFLAFTFFAVAGLLFTPAAFAHTFGAHGAGFADGLAHPFFGLDHMLAMIAVFSLSTIATGFDSFGNKCSPKKHCFN